MLFYRAELNIPFVATLFHKITDVADGLFFGVEFLLVTALYGIYLL